MRFFGILDPASHISRRWRGENRLSGTLHNVRLTWNGREYATAELTAEQIAVFEARTDRAVRLEAMRVLPPELDKTSQQEDDKAQGQQADDAGTPPPRRRTRARLTDE